MNHEIDIKAGSISMVKSRRKTNIVKSNTFYDKIFSLFTKRKSPFKAPPNVSTRVVQRMVSPPVSKHAVQRKVSTHVVQRKVSPKISKHVV